MTLAGAVAKAKSLAKKNSREYFVVFEAGQYDAVDAFDLDTWYAGIPDHAIKFCTSNWPGC